MESLSKWVNSLVAIGTWVLPWQRLKLCVLYADDPSQQQMQILKIVFSFFQVVSGLKVNLHKSSLMTTSTDDNLAHNLAHYMGCVCASYPVTYLGLPLSDKRLNRSHYFPLIQRISGRLSGSLAGNLSIVGRIVLINAILTSTPISYMSAFLIPKWVIAENDKIRRNFLWHGSNINSKKLHLANWSLVCKPKSKGGLGILGLSAMNMALLVRWYWTWFSDELSLWKQINIILGANTREWDTSHPLDFWKQTKRVALPFERSVIFKLGSGKYVSFWHHDWGHGILKFTFNHLFSHCTVQNALVHELATESAIRHTLVPILSESARRELQSLLTDILPSLTDLVNYQIDLISSKLSPDKKHTCKSFYIFLTDTPSPTDTSKAIWKLRAPPRMLVFSWFTLKGKILTIDNLQRRGWSMVNMCMLCRMQEESISHLFDECTFFQESLMLTLHITNLHSTAMHLNDLPSLMYLWIQSTLIPKSLREIVLIVIFVVWRETCTRNFRGNCKTPFQMAQEAHQEWKALATENRNI